MASLIYDSFTHDCMTGAVTPSVDTFYEMLVTSTYAPNKGTNDRRDDVTNEIAGTGYAAGGQAVILTLTKDTTNHREDLTFADSVWPAATFTTRASVIYKRRGGASSADELVCYVDFGSDVASAGGSFTSQKTTPLRYQN